MPGKVKELWTRGLCKSSFSIANNSSPSPFFSPFSYEEKMNIKENPHISAFLTSPSMPVLLHPRSPTMPGCWDANHCISPAHTTHPELCSDFRAQVSPQVADGFPGGNNPIPRAGQRVPKHPGSPRSKDQKSLCKRLL